MATVNNSMNVCQLPDNILLDILSYLSVKDRCKCSRVCRRWRKIVADNSLWRHVDLLPYKVELRKMWKLIRAHLSVCLRTLRIRGFPSKTCVEPKPPLSVAMLKELRERCTGLLWLHMEMGNITNIPSGKHLPSSLTHLTLKKCVWHPLWLADCTDHFPNLVYLDLSSTVRVDNLDVSHIICFDKLTTLLLNDCYRITDTGVQEIAVNLTSLTTLSLRRCDTTDLGIHHIGRHLTALKDLDLSGCRFLTEGCLPSLVEGLTELEQLALDDCDNITVYAFTVLSKSSRLRNISMVHQKNSISISDITPWREKMSKCVISV